MLALSGTPGGHPAATADDRNVMASTQGYLSEIFVSFQGEGAHVGRRHLFVRLGGCNLRCVYCDTPASLERSPTFTLHRGDGTAVAHPNPVAAGDLAALVHEVLASAMPVDAVALTGGEPLTQSEFLAAFLQTARLPVPVLLETSGVLPKQLRDVVALVDIVSMDMKLASNTGERAFWDEHAEFLALASRREVYVKILVDEGTAIEDVARAARLVQAVASHVPVFLQPILDASDRPAIGAARLAALYAAARVHTPAVRVLPQTHKLLRIR